jgi:hypothetical protein
MTVRAVGSWILVGLTAFAGLAVQAKADVLIKAEKHPAGEFLSTNWTFYTDTTLLWTINGYSDSQFFGAGLQVALPYNSSYRFGNTAVISYDQRKLYEVPAGTVLKTPDYVPARPETRPPEEAADPAYCIDYKNEVQGTHCLVKTDEGHAGAYTSVNISVTGSGKATGTAKVEGCHAIATGSAVVVGHGSAHVASTAVAWGCD